MQFLSQHPKGWNYTLSPCGARERYRREGLGLTIAAWTDINLFKLMEVSIPLCYGGMSSIPGHPSNSITRCPTANNSKSIQIVSWWSVTHFRVPFVFLLLLYSSGPCYLHSRLTSSDVFTWEKCNSTPRFTEEDNLCFRQGEAATARGVGFPSLLFTERGRFLLRSAWLQSPSYMFTDWSAGSQTGSSRTHSGCLYFFLSFPLLSLPHSGLCSCLPYTVSDSICLYPCFHLTPPFSYLALSPSLSLPLSGG